MKRYKCAKCKKFTEKIAFYGKKIYCQECFRKVRSEDKSERELIKNTEKYKRRKNEQNVRK